MTEMPKLFEEFLLWARNVVKTRYPTGEYGVDLEMEDIAWFRIETKCSCTIIKLQSNGYHLSDVSSLAQLEPEIFMNRKVNTDWNFDKEYSFLFEKIDEIEKRDG